MRANHPRLTKEQLAKLRDADFSAVPGLTSAESELNKKYGDPGSPSRIEFENKAKAWYCEEFNEPMEELPISRKHALITISIELEDLADEL